MKNSVRQSTLQHYDMLRINCCLSQCPSVGGRAVHSAVMSIRADYWTDRTVTSSVRILAGDKWEEVPAGGFNLNRPTKLRLQIRGWSAEFAIPFLALQYGA